MLRPKPPQNSFYGCYLYDRIIPYDHLLRKINETVDFSFVHDLVKDRYRPDFGRPAEDPEFMLKLCLLQYIYGDSDRTAKAYSYRHSNGHAHTNSDRNANTNSDTCSTCTCPAHIVGTDPRRYIQESCYVPVGRSTEGGPSIPNHGLSY